MLQRRKVGIVITVFEKYCARKCGNGGRNSMVGIGSGLFVLGVSVWSCDVLVALVSLLISFVIFSVSILCLMIHFFRHHKNDFKIIKMCEDFFKIISDSYWKSACYYVVSFIVVEILWDCFVVFLGKSLSFAAVIFVLPGCVVASFVVLAAVLPIRVYLRLSWFCLIVFASFVCLFVFQCWIMIQLDPSYIQRYGGFINSVRKMLLEAGFLGYFWGILIPIGDFSVMLGIRMLVAYVQHHRKPNC